MLRTRPLDPQNPTTLDRLPLLPPHPPHPKKPKRPEESQREYVATQLATPSTDTPNCTGLDPPPLTISRVRTPLSPDHHRSLPAFRTILKDKNNSSKILNGRVRWRRVGGGAWGGGGKVGGGAWEKRGDVFLCIKPWSFFSKLREYHRRPGVWSADNSEHKKNVGGKCKT